MPRRTLMTSRRLAHRSAAILASAGIGAALALVPAGSALAGVQGQLVGEGEASADFTGSGGGTCDLSSGDDNVTTSPVAFSHGTKHRTVNLNATFTNSLDSSDQVQVKGHAESSMTLKKQHQDLRVFDMTTGGHITINHTVTGSQCKGAGALVVLTQVNFTEKKKGTFTLTRDTKKPNSLAEFVLVDLNRDQVVALDAFEGDHSHASSRATLKPGKYAIAMTELGIFSNGGLLTKSGAKSSKVAQTIHLHGEFTPKKH